MIKKNGHEYDDVCGAHGYCGYHDKVVPFCYNKEHWAYECSEPFSGKDEALGLVHIVSINSKDKSGDKP